MYIVYKTLLNPQSCDCNPQGSMSLQCNANTGICQCREGVHGDKCELCEDEFYGLDIVGCHSCNCNIAGSTTTICNKTSGICDCKVTF